MVDERAQLEVKTLGESRIDSPLAALLRTGRTTQHYVDESDRVLLDDTVSLVAARGVPVEELPGFEPGGPRRKIFFDPSKTRVGIVTCGGLCPGLNDVIRALVLELTNHYGVRRIFGFRNGYQGMTARYGRSVVDLDASLVAGINEYGGTILGTSRGNQDPDEIVDCLEQLSVNVLFVIGGDGSMRGALKIAEVVAERGGASRSSGCRRRSTTTSRTSNAPSASRRPSPRPRRRSAPRTWRRPRSRTGSGWCS
ncbi:6-phosphofructokinase [Dactylosporangium cerinum]